MEMVVYGSGNIGDVLVEAECRVYSDVEVFGMVINDVRCTTKGGGLKLKF